MRLDRILKVEKEFTELRVWIECMHKYTIHQNTSCHYDECVRCGYSAVKLKRKLENIIK